MRFWLQNHKTIVVHATCNIRSLGTNLLFRKCELMLGDLFHFIYNMRASAYVNSIRINKFPIQTNKIIVYNHLTQYLFGIVGNLFELNNIESIVL